MKYCKNLVSFWDQHLYKHFSSDKKYEYSELRGRIQNLEEQLKYTKNKLVTLVKKEEHELYLKEVNYKE